MGAYEAVKDIAKLAQQMDNPELLQRTLEAQQQTLDLQEEVQTLRQKVRELERRDEIAEQLVWDDGIYWRSVDGEDEQGPFCQLCWDDRSKLIRLQDIGGRRFTCNACNNTIYHDAATDDEDGGTVWRGRG